MRGILARLGRLLAEEQPTAADVRALLDMAYQHHLATLTAVRRTDARLGALGRRLDFHVGRLEDLSGRLGRLAGQESGGPDATATGPAGDLRALADRRSALLDDRELLQSARRRLGQDEARLTAAVEAFRVQRAALLGSGEATDVGARARRLVAGTAADLAAVEAALVADRVLGDRIADGLRHAADVSGPAIGRDAAAPRFEQPPGPDASPSIGPDLR